MKNTLRALRRGLIVVLALLMIAPATAFSQDATVLMQEDFEGAFANDPNCQDGKCNVPQGWRVWFIPHRDTDPQGVNYPPEFGQSNTPNRAKSGAAAQRLFTENRTFTAGLYRVITNVKVGSKLRLSMWGQSWSTNDNSPISARPSTDIKLKIGIDPGAEGDTQPSPFNGRVVWSPEQDAKDAYAQFSVEAEAKSSTIIVWTYATMKDVVRHNEVFWDDALVEVVVPAPTATPDASSAAAAVAEVVTPTVEATVVGTGGPDAVALQQTGGITYTVKEGDTLYGIALQFNKEIDELRRLNEMQDDLLSIGQVLVIEAPGTGAAAPAPTQAPADAGNTSGDTAAQPADPGAQGETGPTTEGDVTSTPGFGALCVQAYFDNNGDGVRDPGEDLVPGIQFGLTSGGQSLGAYTSDGVNEPYCFSNLAEGAFTVAATISPDYVATTPLNDTVNVGGGANSAFSLGIRRASAGNEVIEYTPTPSAEASNGGGGPSLLAILATIGGALLILGTIGFGVLFFLQGRRL